MHGGTECYQATGKCFHYEKSDLVAANYPQPNKRALRNTKRPCQNDKDTPQPLNKWWNMIPAKVLQER